MSERSRETSSTSAWARSRFDQKSGAAMRPSIAARSFWSFSTSKKPPQFAGTRFQVLGIGDGDFRWHEGKYSRLRSAQNVAPPICAQNWQVLASRQRAQARDGKLFRLLSSDRDDRAQPFPDRERQSCAA